MFELSERSSSLTGQGLAVLGCFWTSPGTFGYLHTFQPAEHQWQERSQHRGNGPWQPWDALEPGATSLQHLLPAVRRLHRLHSAQGSPARVGPPLSSTVIVLPCATMCYLYITLQ